MNRTVTFVMGATASGKTTFIKNMYFSDKKDTVVLNVYDYQQAAYKEAGSDLGLTFEEKFQCLYEANEKLLLDIIKTLQENKNVVVEQTFYKAKRRITYIEAIRNAVENVVFEIYVMCPSEAVWKTYRNERELGDSSLLLKALVKEIEFPNLSEGFDKIYEVVDGTIRLRMDVPMPEIVTAAHKELDEEAQQMRQEKEAKKQRSELLESMNSRPFWHYCEVCGTKVFCTAQEAFDAGWDYPPQIGFFGLLGPRTCGKCKLKDTLYFKVQQQELPIVFEKALTKKELKTWQRIKKEPESLLYEEK